jgi:hypothetical protein
MATAPQPGSAEQNDSRCARDDRSETMARMLPSFRIFIVLFSGIERLRESSAPYRFGLEEGGLGGKGKSRAGGPN